MKKIIVFNLLNFFLVSLNAQTNTFPGSGNVGIGTLNPQAALHVYGGNIIFQNSNVGIQFKDLSSSNNFQMGLATSIGAYCRLTQPGDFVISKVNTPGNLYISNQQNGAIYFSTGTSYTTENIIMSVIGSNVGIGTTDTKGYKLAVNGSAIFTKAVVKLYSNWPDYVFEKNYPLITLDSVEAFIKKNNHLPNISSADYINENGIDLGENQKTLLQKTEELTLYIISQNKTIIKQSAQIQTLESKMNSLEQQLELLKHKIDNK